MAVGLNGRLWSLVYLVKPSLHILGLKNQKTTDWSRKVVPVLFFHGEEVACQLALRVQKNFLWMVSAVDLPPPLIIPGFLLSNSNFSYHNWDLS